MHHQEHRQLNDSMNDGHGEELRTPGTLAGHLQRVRDTYSACSQVLELVAETAAPQREIELLLADAPQEAPQEARAATASAIAEAEDMASPRPPAHLRRSCDPVSACPP